MIVPIVPVTDPVLRKLSKPVKRYDKKLIQLVTDLKDTLLAQKDPEGVGLAAPQIGKNICVFAIKPEPKDDVSIFINPKILKIVNTKNKVAKSKEVFEGCLSLPNYWGPIRRAAQVTLEYEIPSISNGKITTQKIKKTFEGFPAQVVLHEVDHLSGILFIDHLLKDKKPLYKIHPDDSWEEVQLI